jgi:hypothetical protein
MNETRRSRLERWSAALFKERVKGIEPPPQGLEGLRSTVELHPRNLSPQGIEPWSTA